MSLKRQSCSIPTLKQILRSFYNNRENFMVEVYLEHHRAVDVMVSGDVIDRRWIPYSSLREEFSSKSCGRL